MSDTLEQPSVLPCITLCLFSRRCKLALGSGILARSLHASCKKSTCRATTSWRHCPFSFLFRSHEERLEIQRGMRRPCRGMSSDSTTFPVPSNATRASTACCRKLTNSSTPDQLGVVSQSSKGWIEWVKTRAAIASFLTSSIDHRSLGREVVASASEPLSSWAR
jgi:hypothetical protein